jgi:glucan biosynthesis protein C
MPTSVSGHGSTDMQPAADRLHALDAVRAFALLLGILLHGTSPFLAGMKGWVTVEASTDVMAGVFYFIHMFRMPVFFLIAGYFGRLLLERRGTKAFIRDRAKRILVPLVAGLPVVFIVIVVMYLLAALATGMDLKAIQAQQQTAQAEGQGDGFNLAHLWFLYYLAMFYAVALLIRAALGQFIDRGGKLQASVNAVVRFLMRGVWGPVILALPIAAFFYQSDTWSSWTGLPAPFSIVPQAGALLSYGLIFGWLLQRQSHLMLALEKGWPMYLALAVVLAIVCYLIAGPTPRWAPYLEGRSLLIYSAAYMIATWCWVFGLIGAAIQFLSNVSPVRRYLADSSYWLYLMHVPALFFFHVLFKPLDWHWSVKYVLSIAGAMPILLLSYHYFVRFTFIGAILNGKRYPRPGRRPADPAMAA